MEKNNTILIPRIRFPEFEGEWEAVSLGDLLSFKNGLNAQKEQYGSGTKFINVMDVLSNEGITYDNILGKVEIDQKEFELYSVQYGDILFQRSSETREEVGSANVYLDNEKKAVFGGFVIRGRMINEYHPQFMNYTLKTQSARKDISSRSGGSTRYNIGQGSLAVVKLPLPTLPEQRKIAAFLSAVDRRIDLQRQYLEQLRRYKQGAMQQIFSQEIRFQDENGGDFPAWEEKKLGEVADFFSGGTPKTTSPRFYNGKISFIKSGEISSFRTAQSLTEQGLKNSSAKLVKKGDLLYALYGATSGEVAISKINGAINQAVLCIRPQFERFYLYFFLTSFKEKILSKYLQGGQGNLSAQILKSLKLPLPSLPEQQKIASFLSALDEKIDRAQEKLGELEEFKRGLLQGMFV